MTTHRKLARAVVAVPLADEHCRLIERLEPRIEVFRDSSLTRPGRRPADWGGDPEFTRTREQQRAYDVMVDSADVLFGIPDDDSAALARTVKANPGLRCVLTTAAGGGGQVKAAGLDQSDLKRIRFATSAGVHGGPLAEFAVFGALAGLKDLPRLLADQNATTWPERWEMRQLSDCTVLIVGMGGIGSQCASRFRALGATVWGTSRTERTISDVDRVIPADDLADAASQADVVVVTLPNTERTRHLVDESVFARLRDCVFVSIGRGTVVDEAALLAALNCGNVRFTALDVFELEPLPASSELWSHPHVLISPHTAALTSSEEERVARRFAENASRLLDGRPLLAEVDIVEFY